jgi:hypothetical protein
VPTLQAATPPHRLTTPINSRRRIPNPRDQLRSVTVRSRRAEDVGGGRTKYIWGLSRSVQGQSRHSDRGLATSGLPRTTDIIRASRHVSNVPTHEVAALQPAAREQEPRGRQPVERTAMAGWQGRHDQLMYCRRRVHHRDRHQHTIPIALAALPGAMLPATSFLGAFWTPASSVCRASRRCRRPKTSTLTDSFTAATARPIRSPHRRDVRVCRVRSQQMPSRPTRSSHRDSDLGRECRLGPIDPSIRAAAA